MIRHLKVTCVVDNRTDRQDLLVEHGLAFFVEADAVNILFDTGQRDALLPNARTLGISFDRLDAIVISHGHYDHTGALAQALERAPSAALFVYPAALEPKYARISAPPYRYIGIPEPGRRALDAARRRIVWTETPQPVAPGVAVTGGIPRRSGFEDPGGPFFRDPDCELEDPIPDDQAMILETAQGTLVLLGCAHSGVVNTLEHVSEITNGRQIHTIAGGMHLRSASGERLRNTAQALDRFGVTTIAPCHCTGTEATRYLRSHLGTRVREYTAGCSLLYTGDR